MFFPYYNKKFAFNRLLVCKQLFLFQLHNICKKSAGSTQALFALQVSYLTALDIYYFACFTFVLFTVLEYCLLNSMMTAKRQAVQSVRHLRRRLSSKVMHECFS